MPSYHGVDASRVLSLFTEDRLDHRRENSIRPGIVVGYDRNSRSIRTRRCARSSSEVLTHDLDSFITGTGFMGA
jgi:hypothetical protein